MTNGTPSNEDISGAYIQFQTAVLRNLPRPHQIDATTREGWIKNGQALQVALERALTPTADTLFREIRSVTVDGGEIPPTNALKQLGDRLFVYESAWHLIPHATRSSRSGKVRLLKPTRPCSFIDAYQELSLHGELEWADIHQFLKAQLHGEDGPLVKRGWNYFFVSNDCHPRGTYLFKVGWGKRNKEWLLSRCELGESNRIREEDRILAR
jgi:hypothetical protein